jgi:8-oxo-dGTP diphosphatase
VEVGWTRVAAYALCHDDGRILLTRFAAPGHPDHGKWTMPGGRMEWGETIRETAHRELLEETGLTAALGEVAGVYSRWFTAEESVRREPGHLVGIVFHASRLTGELRKEFDDDDTTDAAQWFPIDGVEALPHVDLVDFALALAD